MSKMISWVQVTWNRLDTTKRCYEANVRQGREGTQLIWVDNGSEDGSAAYAVSVVPDVLILNKTNLGCPHAYNQALAMATGDYLFLAASDHIYPEHWIRDMPAVLEAGYDFACYYSPEIGGRLPERRIGEPLLIGELLCQPCVPAELMMVTREAFNKVGFLTEEYGLYGWCDEEWNLRAHSLGLKGVCLPEPLQHFGTTGMDDHHSEHETVDYWQWKSAQCREPWKLELINKRRKEGFPYHNPWMVL
jgi:GT2 family glycosyltransferase